MNPGDVVRLKSGGPPMTVVVVDGSYATCTWFDEANKLQKEDFLQVTLAPYDEDGELPHFTAE